MRILSILSLFGPGFAKFLSFDNLSISNWICVQGSLEPFHLMQGAENIVGLLRCLELSAVSPSEKVKLTYLK